MSGLFRLFSRAFVFRGITLQVRGSVQRGVWATSLDLRDAYFHVLIHRHFRKWLRFTWADRVFQFRALPFGLSLSPWVFTRVTRELAILLRQQAIRIRLYLDDWLVLSQSQSLCSAHTQTVCQTAASLGFVLNLDKLDLAPSQTFEYLGMVIDTRTLVVRPAEKRLQRFQQTLLDLRSRCSASARQLSALLGSMESLAALVSLGRLHKHPLQRGLSQRWSPAQGSWDDLIPLGSWFLQATERWLDFDWLRSTVPLVLPAPQLELFTDASTHGWGAHVDDLTASGSWSVSQFFQAVFAVY